MNALNKKVRKSKCVVALQRTKKKTRAKLKGRYAGKHARRLQASNLAQFGKATVDVISERGDQQINATRLNGRQ